MAGEKIRQLAQIGASRRISTPYCPVFPELSCFFPPETDSSPTGWRKLGTILAELARLLR
jgi:hypothetical protein